jgi:hypothetical protein
MALQPSKFNGQDRLQSGARGELFQVDLPGYRDQGDRVNRTQNKLATNEHDVPNVKYEFDRRLPVLFRYGFAYGYNQIVVPKGRLVSADPYMDLVDFDMKHAHNTLTLANGGAPVRIRKVTDTYRNDSGDATSLVSAARQGAAVLDFTVNKDWTPLIGQTAAYTKVSYRPFQTEGPMAQLMAQDAPGAGMYYAIDENTGRIAIFQGLASVHNQANHGGNVLVSIADDLRPGNIPVGVIQRNEYTRDDDAYNGIMPGAVLTDAMVELPWFAYKDKAEQNPWGSAYGGLFPGALVKSDENGRFVVSPLSFPEVEVSTMGIQEYELERQQVVGQVYSVDNSLVPEGAAKWATWALSDRLNFEGFNPDLYRQNNRTGEDSIGRSPYNSVGQYPGHPYDRTIGENDLHMLASTARNYSNRMNQEYQFDNLGIPGLTDGFNAVVREYQPETAGHINYAGGVDYVDMFFRTAEVNIEPNSLQVSLGDAAFAPCTEGAMLTSTVGVDTDSFIKVKYANELQGVVVLEVADKAKADTFLQAHNGLKVRFKYSKRGLSGVPTFLDWDGCVGSVKVLLTK